MHNSLYNIDINCDIGQNWGAFLHIINEDLLLPYITSINIPFGGHAGDNNSVINSLKLAQKYNLAIGAHIGYPDIINFGRKEILSNDEILHSIAMQISQLNTMANLHEQNIQHIRPHAALTHKIMSDMSFAERLADIILNINPWLYLLMPAGNYLMQLQDKTGLLTIGEAYIDKQYRKDGIKKNSLNQNNKFLTKEYIKDQIDNLLDQSRVITENNQKQKIHFRSIHVKANILTSEELTLELIKYLHNKLQNNNRLKYFAINSNFIENKDFTFRSISQNFLN